MARRPLTITAQGGQLSWKQVADYYGISVRRLIEQSGMSWEAKVQASRNPGQPIRDGVILRVPNVRDGVGQRRPRNNVFNNTRYIQRVTGGGGGGQAGGGAGGSGPSEPVVPVPTGTGEPPGDEDEGGNPGTDFDVPETPGGLTEREARNAIQMAIAAFPWIDEMGLTEQVTNWIRNDGYTGEALVGLIRQEPAWQAMFVGLRRDDGTLRMNEQQYLSTMDQYRSVLQRQFGAQALSLTNAELSNFMVNEIDANEVSDRLRIYDQLVQHGTAVRAAFYVYGGMRMSDDDLYSYVVDPFTQRRFNDQYLAAQPPDYNTFLTRTAETVIDATGAPITTEQAVPLLDVLYHGGNPTGGDYLSLAELTNAFELAMLGSTATSQGLVMPDIETVMQMRSAGVNRTQALQAYGQFVRDRNILNAMSARAGDGTFTQSEFEDATFLADGDILRDVNRAQAQENARSQAAGAFEFSRTGPGRIGQEGFSALRS